MFTEAYASGGSSTIVIRPIVPRFSGRHCKFLAQFWGKVKPWKSSRGQTLRDSTRLLDIPRQ